MYFQRQLRDRLRVVLPHEGVVIGVVVMYLLTDVAQLLVGLAQHPQAGIALPRENDAGGGMAVIAAVVYGGFRAGFFHPFYRKDYREWLQRTPWVLGQRLPLGPVHIVWQDVCVLCVLTLATLRMSEPTPAVVPLAFLLTYVAVSLLPLLNTGESQIAFVIAVLLGAAGRWSTEPIVVGVLLSSVYGLCLLGLRRSLSRVHEWDLTWWDGQGLSEVFSRNMALAEAARKKVLGWPWDRLSLKKIETRVSLPVGVCLSLLTGWWLHALLHCLVQQAGGWGRPPAPWGVAAMLTMPGLILAAIRVGIYVWGYAPPLSLIARLVRFRWIIPGYDSVFIAPACIVVLALCGPHAVDQMGIPWEYGLPLIAGLMMLVALTMPPSLDEWRLTGRHRIVPATQTQQNELMQA